MLLQTWMDYYSFGEETRSWREDACHGPYPLDRYFAQWGDETKELSKRTSLVSYDMRKSAVASLKLLYKVSTDIVTRCEKQQSRRNQIAAFQEAKFDYISTRHQADATLEELLKTFESADKMTAGEEFRRVMATAVTLDEKNAAQTDMDRRYLSAHLKWRRCHY